MSLQPRGPKAHRDTFVAVTPHGLVVRIIPIDWIRVITDPARYGREERGVAALLWCRATFRLTLRTELTGIDARELLCDVLGRETSEVIGTGNIASTATRQGVTEAMFLDAIAAVDAAIQEVCNVNV